MSVVVIRLSLITCCCDFELVFCSMKFLFTLKFRSDCRHSMAMAGIRFGLERIYCFLLCERNNAFDYTEMAKVHMWFSCYLQFGASNDVDYHFLLLHLPAVLEFSIITYGFMSCVWRIACVLRDKVCNWQSRNHVIIF